MSVDLEKLLTAACEAAHNAYAPYSNFRVGSALLLTNGAIVTGVNVENASYGLTICAERSAISRAIGEFGPDIQVIGIAVANLNASASPPCGACRQVLSEFASPDAQIIFNSLEGSTSVSFRELTPYFFSKKYL